MRSLTRALIVPKKGSGGTGGSGTVTHTPGALTANQLVIGNGADDEKVLGSLGTTTTVLHGNAAGAPTFGAVDLTADVSGDLPFANLAQGAALSVLGVTGNATADVAAIAAGSDGQVLRRSGTAVAFGAVSLSTAAAVTGALPIGNGGTGQTAQAAAFDALSPLTTRGDVLIRNNTGNTRLAAGASGQFLQTLGASADPVFASQKVLLSGQTAALVGPADASVYFFGTIALAPILATDAARKFTCPVTGVIRRVDFLILGDTGATNESSTLVLRINGADAVTLGSSGILSNSAALNVAFTGLSQAVTAADLLSFKITHPTWVTNPAAVLYGYAITVEVP